MRSDKSFWITAIATYTIAWGWSFLFANAYFWDDWHSFFGKTPQEHAQFWGGSPKKHFLNPIINPFLLTQFSGVWIFRVLVFAMMFGAGVFVYKIISRIHFFPRESCQFFTLVFLLVPVNHARFSIQTFEYSFSVFFFFLGWYLILLRKPVWRLCSLGAFLIAIGTPSLSVFMVLPLINLYFEDQPRSIRSFLIWLTKHIDVYILVIVSMIFYKSVDNGTSQYTTRTSGIVYSILFGCVIFAYLFLLLSRKQSRPIRQQTLISSAIALIWLGTIPYWIIGYNPIKALPNIFQLYAGARIHDGEYLLLMISVFKLVATIFIGFLVLYLSSKVRNIGSLITSNLLIFLYLINTYFVGPMQWESRLQLLWPLGLALLSLGLFEKIPIRFHRKNTFALVIMLTFVTSLISAEYYVDSLKQRALVSEIQTVLKNPNGKVLIVTENGYSLNARQRTYRNYEWSGIINSAIHDDRNTLKTVVILDDDLTCTIFIRCVALHATVKSSFFQVLISRHVDIEIKCNDRSPIAVPPTSLSCISG